MNDEAIWYLGVDGEQSGPFTRSDIVARISRAELDAEALVYADGEMADWVPLNSVPEFAEALSQPSMGGRAPMPGSSSRSESSSGSAFLSVAREGASAGIAPSPRVTSAVPASSSRSEPAGAHSGAADGPTGAGRAGRTQPVAAMGASAGDDDDEEAIWYIGINGEQSGPFAQSAVLARIAAGELPGATLVFAGGVTPDWVALESVPVLASSLPGSVGGRAGVAAPPPLPGSAPVVADPIGFTVIGDDLQLVEIELEPGHTVVAEAGAMLYMDGNIVMEAIMGDGSAGDAGGGIWGALKGAAKRVLTGESLFMTTFVHRGPDPKARVAFAAPYPGKIVPVHLAEIGGVLICQKEAFLCGARGVAVGIELQKKIGVGLFGGEGFILQRLEGNGQVFLHAGGTIVNKELAAGETLRLDTGCLVAFQPTVTYDIEMQNDIKTALFGGEGLILATLSGPGRVWLQSLPFSRLASRIYAAARQTGGGGRGEGSLLGGVFGAIGGDR